MAAKKVKKDEKKAEHVKKVEKKEVKEEVVVKKQCNCRTEAGFRKNPVCGPGTGCLA